MNRIMFINNYCKLTEITKPEYWINSDYFNFQIVKEIQELDIDRLTKICIITKEIIKVINNIMIDKVKFILYIKSTNIYYQLGDVYIINQIQKLMANRTKLNIDDIINNKLINNNDFEISNLISQFIRLDESDLYIKKICNNNIPLLIISCFNISNFTIFNPSSTNLSNNLDEINKELIDWVYQINSTNVNLQIIKKYIEIFVTSDYIIEKKMKIFKKNVVWNFEEESIEPHKLIEIMNFYVAIINNKSILDEYIMLISEIVYYSVNLISNNEKFMYKMIKKSKLNEIKIKKINNSVIINEENNIGSNTSISISIIHLKNQYTEIHNSNLNIIYKIDIKYLNCLNELDLIDSNILNDLKCYYMDGYKLLFGYKEVKFILKNLVKIKLVQNIKLISIKYNLQAIKNILFNKINNICLLPHEFLSNNHKSGFVKANIVKDKQRLIELSKNKLGSRFDSKRYFISKVLDYELVPMQHILYKTFNIRILKLLNKLQISYYNENNNNKYNFKRKNTFNQTNNNNNKLIDDICIKELINLYLPICIRKSILFNNGRYSHLKHFERYDLISIIHHLKISNDRKMQIWYEIYKECKDSKMVELDVSSFNSFYNCKYGKELTLIINDTRNEYFPHSCIRFKKFCPYINENNNNNTIVDIEDTVRILCTKELNNNLSNNNIKPINRNIRSPISYHIISYLKRSNLTNKNYKN